MIRLGRLRTFDTDIGLGEEKEIDKVKDSVQAVSDTGDVNIHLPSCLRRLCQGLLF